jgi:hypothetical protein
MEFIKTETADLNKLIIVIEKTKNGGCTKKIYGSLLDMPESERKAYIANAFSDMATNDQTNPEEMWARHRLEHMLEAKMAKTARRR